MNDELDTLAFDNTDLKWSTPLICTDQHHETVEVKHPDWVPVGVHHVLVLDPVPARTVENHGSTSSTYLDTP